MLATDHAKTEKLDQDAMLCHHFSAAFRVRLKKRLEESPHGVTTTTASTTTTTTTVLFILFLLHRSFYNHLKITLVSFSFPLAIATMKERNESQFALILKVKAGFEFKIDDPPRIVKS